MLHRGHNDWVSPSSPFHPLLPQQPMVQQDAENLHKTFCPSESPDINPSPNCSGGEEPCTTHQMLGPSRGRKLWWQDMEVLEQEGNGMSIRSKEKSLGWKWRPHCPENLSTWGRKLYHWFNSPWTQSSSQLFFFSRTFFSSLLSFHKANPSISVR